MKNKYYIFLIISSFFFFVNAQSSYYYYYKGKKVFLNLDRKNIIIITSNDISFNDNNISMQNIIAKPNYYVKQLTYNNELSFTDFFQNYNSLLNNPDVLNIGLFFKRSNSSPIGISNIFYIKLKNSNDYALLQQLANSKGVTIDHQNQFMPLWYQLKVNPHNLKTSLELSNEFYETGQFADVDPAFMFNFGSNCTNDSDFNQLWGLNNTSNPDIDINACDAWTISEGNGVNVAVLDQGVYKLHHDLDGNISPLSFDTESNSSPSVYTSGYNHGTHVSGTIAAEKNNNLQVVGVAPSSQIMSVSHRLILTPDISEELANGINWAWQNGADVINNSWGDQGGSYYDELHSSLLENAILNALTNGRNGKGTIVNFAAGNHAPAIDYPASFNENIICVGALRSSGERSSFSGYGNELDIVAPGSSILSTIPPQGTASWNGTSMATPHITGVVALILSVNSCLSGQQVRDIIEQTAQKVRTDLYSYTNQNGRPNGTWNEEMGYGLVDAYAAVQLAQQMNSSTLDLYVKDRPDDMGIEPNPTPDNMWISQDIWIRNVDDDGLTHQNPEYNANGNPNYIYVRVINKSCVVSTGNETLTINWAKANTALTWPDNWDGSIINPNGYPLGGVLPTATIPVLQPGDETIVKIPWVVPNPDNYNTGQGSDNPWHFCLLAQIDDGNPVTMTSNPNVMVRNENNLAWKNVTIVDLVTNITTASVMIANPTNITKTYYLELIKDNNETGKAVYEEAEVTLKMDETLFNAWERGGKIAQEVEAKQDEKEKLVKGNNVLLDNINFNANERGLLTLDFKFLTEQVTDKEEFTYHVIQKDAQTGEIIGGETFIIRKKQRPLFVANAGDDKEVDLNETVTITAEDINEVAEYNWYDSEGNLIYQGKDLSVSADISKKYKLEVVTTDGFKDYDEVEVKLRPGYIKTISPNPSTNLISVDYKLNGASSAYLMIIGVNSGSSNNYILDTSTSTITIDISSYQTGYYTIAIVCDGQITDAKQLLKQ